jgi:DNA-directed RNA polymerase specialized sigma24 family protein
LPTDPPSRTEHPALGGFHTTHWSVVFAAASGEAPDARDALETLCATYWYPLYAWTRRQRHMPADAEDLVQSFFAHILARNRLQTTSPLKGKFRSFLLASLKHFLANERDRAGAQKRGGSFTLVSIDAEASEGRYQLEPAHESSPDKAFEKEWAMILLDAVLIELRREYVSEGREALYAALSGSLSGEVLTRSYLELGVALGLSEGAVKMSVQRLRRRFGELLRQEIGRTVGDPQEIDDEIRALFAAVQR